MRRYLTHGPSTRWAVERRSPGAGLSLVWLVWDGLYWVERWRSPGEFYDTATGPARLGAVRAARVLSRRRRAA